MLFYGGPEGHGVRRLIGTFYLLAPKLVFHKLRSRQIDHPYEDAYDLFVPHGRASHERASHGHMSHGRVPCRRHLHLIGVYLTGVHLMGVGVYLITLFRGCTATGDIAGSCLQECGLSGSAALPASVIKIFVPFS
jgi:hypothetical protein